MSPPASLETIHLGVGITSRGVHVSSSDGQRSAIGAEAPRPLEEWLELVTYGLQLPERHRLLACVALPSGLTDAERDRLVGAARNAGWDGVLLDSALHAAARALVRVPRPEALAVLVVDPTVSSVGVLGGESLDLLEDDPVHPIAGREARELAVSLRVLLKARPRAQSRRLLERVVVTGDGTEVERIGRRRLRDELEGLGVEQVAFELDPFLVARGAQLIASETSVAAWQRVRRRFKR